MIASKIITITVINSCFRVFSITPLSTNQRSIDHRWWFSITVGVNLNSLIVRWFCDSEILQWCNDHAQTSCTSFRGVKCPSSNLLYPLLWVVLSLDLLIDFSTRSIVGWFNEVRRHNRWPSPHVVDEIRKVGCHVVPKPSTDSLIKLHEGKWEVCE